MMLAPDNTAMYTGRTAALVAPGAPFFGSLTNPLRLERVRQATAARAECVLDRLTHAAVSAIRTPVAAIAFVEQDRQIFKSVTGLPASWADRRELPLSYSFCVHAVASGRPLIIDDARRHPLVQDNPSVTELGVRAYAGVPLTTRDGLVLGTFHALSWAPHEWTHAEIALLRGLAAVAMMEIERQLGEPAIAAAPARNGNADSASSRPDARIEAHPSIALARNRREAALRARLQRAIGNEFLVGARIGRGGFADVYDGWDRRLKRCVALKVPRPDIVASPAGMTRFRTEAENIAAVRHPHVLPIHRIGEGQGLVWLVLDRVVGESLDAWMNRVNEAPIGEATRILRAVASALHAAHTAGIVHRDLTPGNVMLDGPDRHVLLMDFGLARALRGDLRHATDPGTLVGTPHFMSPEQAAGDAVDARSDVYSLGVIGYRLLTGRLPIEGPTFTTVMMRHLVHVPTPVCQLRPECPQWLAELVGRCLVKEPEARWQSADAIVHAIETGR